MAESGHNIKEGANTGRRRKEQETEHDESASGRSSSTQSRTSPILKRASTTPHMSTGTSATTSPRPSPKPSREASPIRQPVKGRSNLSTNSPSRSRKNSVDRSPVRATGAAIPTVPSAAAIQRALSAAGAGHGAAASQLEERSDLSRLHRPTRASGGPTPKSTPRTPRLSSPPPAASSKSNVQQASTFKRPDQSPVIPSTPSMTADRPILVAKETDSGSKEESVVPQSGAKTPTRGVSGAGGALETVPEGISPSTPSNAQKGGDDDDKSKVVEKPAKTETNPMEEAFEKESHKKQAESGYESSKSTGKKSGDESKEGWRPATGAGPSSSKAPAIHSKKSYTNLPGKLRAAAEGSVKNMTVETETVSSVPQVAVGGSGERSAPGRSDTTGSLRIKKSNETIRPKKDKKKVTRKGTALNAGTASSKADIFEAKVASAVGDADSSDSEETFVYESNPPEQPPSRKFHSRTPSTASTISQIDHFANKNRQDSHHNIAKKKSMKFATNYNTINPSSEDASSARVSAGQSSRVSTPHHHHIGRFARGGHASIFDKESPFSNGSKPPRTAAAQLQHSARAGGQRSPNAAKLHGSSRKAEEMLYDAEAEAADDERAPLIGSVRSGRNRRRPLSGSARQAYAERNQRWSCGRITAFASLGSLLIVLIAAIVLIVTLCTKTLAHVAIQDIRNVLASESEIMLDLEVSAINPNIIAITVSDLDLNIFAKSHHVGTSYISPPLSGKRRLPPYMPDPEFVNHGVDHGTDPMPYPDDPASDSQTMLLGRILTFDSPLIFDASPLHHRHSVSVGEVRLSRPGNKTEEGGSARWERVLRHDFELIVRGVIKYSLPISSKKRSASIGGKIIVHPTEEDGEGGMKVTKPRLRKGEDDGSNVIIRPYRPPPFQSSSTASLDPPPTSAA